MWRDKLKSWLGRSSEGPPGHGARSHPEDSRMPPTDPKQAPKGLHPPKMGFILGYLLLAMLMLWIWQDAVHDMRVRTIPYSEFKARLAAGEVVKARVGETDIEGEIDPRRAAATQPAQQAEGPNDQDGQPA